MVIEMSKKDKIKMGANKWYESLKEHVDAKCSSDEVKNIIDSVKIQLEVAHAGIAVLEKFLAYAEGAFKKWYAEEEIIAKEIDDLEDELFDELAAMHDKSE